MWVSLRRGPHVSQELSVSSVYCIGLNYADHAAEMQSQRPDEPVVFLKPAASLVAGGGTVAHPVISTEMHHEVELVVLVGQDAPLLTLANAHEAILGYGIGLDMTLRDRQQQAKAKGQPWAVAKGFAQSAPVSAFIPAEQIPDPGALGLQLLVNGQTRQQGSAGQMLFSVHELLVYLSSIFSLRRGDLIFTGTPAGVGPVKRGDQLQARLLNGETPLLQLDVEIV